VKTHKEIKPLPFPVYFWTVAGLALAGLANTVYLAVSHYRVYTDMGYQSFCAISKSINCDTVSQSSFSIFLNVPVAVWGIVGYLFFLALLFSPDRKYPSNKNRLWPTLFVVSLCFSIYSIILALISILYIHSYCIMCIASYAVNFGLLYSTWLTHRRFGKKSIRTELKSDFRFIFDQKRRHIVLLSALVVSIVLLISFFPNYWVVSVLSSDKLLPRGMTEDGHPWIGAENPRLVITEFTDYQCFQCKKMHFYLRQLVAHYPDRIRLVHRHFPMDHAYNPLVKEPYHVGSGKMALFALYAAKKDHFWEINDMLFNMDTRKGHFNIREMAKTGGFDLNEFAGSVKDRNLLHALVNDIRDGIKLGITGTPAYLINGEIHIGHVPSEILNMEGK
jgi:protein-disulfide isomerase/uncharacterized membrane protein